MGHNKNNKLHEIKWANYGSFYIGCEVTHSLPISF